MLRDAALGCAVAVFLILHTVQAQEITGLDVRSTSVIKRTPVGERQMVRLTFVASQEFRGLAVAMHPSGADNPVVMNLDSVRSGKNVRFLEIPPLRTADSVRVDLNLRGRSLAAQRALFAPPKRWRVYDVQVSHHDLGYADYYHLMRRDVREMGIEMALDFCRKTDAWDKNARFHWTVETSEPMTKFISSQPRAVLEDLVRRVREGRIELGGLHNSVYTEMMGPELMARMLYTPNRYVVDLLGVPPSRTALIDDVVGFTRTLPLFLKEADIAYFYHGYNETINGLDPASQNPAFFWKANDGDTVKMPLFRSFPYYSPDRLLKYDLPEVAGLLLKYDADPRWVYDCLIAEDSYDFSVPQFENVEGIRRWNERFANPVLTAGTFTMFFDDIMRQAERSALPVYDEDAPNAWADQDASDGRLMGDARLLNYDVPVVEKLATVVFASGGKGYPWLDLWQSYHKLLMYHEHTNGAFSEEDVLPVPLLKDRKAANANYYECEQVMHKALVREATAFATSARNHAVDQFSRLLTTTHDQTAVVFNSLSWQRSGLARVTPPAGVEWIVRDIASGLPVPSQVLPDGTLLFRVSDVPSMGYRTFHLERGSPVESGSLTVNGLQMENEFYRVTIDSIGGGVVSVWDKRRVLELVDQSAPYRLSEYIYQRMDDPGARRPTTFRPKMISAASFAGPLAAGIVTRIQAVGCDMVEQTVTLYAGSATIDFRVRLDKTDSGRMLKQYSSQNKEALFYAMPLNVPGFTIHHELAGGVVEPLSHQFSGSTSNFFGIQHFSDFSNNRFGVTVVNRNAPLVEYGTARPALWSAPNDAESVLKKPEKSHLFFYLMNNMFFTNIPISQPGEAEFSWSIRAHDGGWREGRADRFAWESSHPLETFVVSGRQAGTLPEGSQSFLSVDRENIVVSTVKPAEANGEGFILRFLETTGTATDVSVNLPLFGKIRSAEETNLVEVDRGIPLPLTGPQAFRFSIRPFGLTTVRVIPEPAQPLTEPRGLLAQAHSDREVDLRWNPVAGAGMYRIYRSTVRDFIPALINCVGTAEGPLYRDAPVLNHGGWLDNRLDPGTTYYYRVEAVGRMNDHSRPSTTVAATTFPSSVRNSRPNKVIGLEATNVSPVSDCNYVCLLFYTNIEPDVAAYRVYRGESPGFIADSTSLLNVVDATTRYRHVTPHDFASVTRALRDYAMIVYPDETTVPNREYFYRVCAVDSAGQTGELSDEVSAKTVIRRLVFAGSRFFFDSATVDIRPFLNDGSQIRYTQDGTTPDLTSRLYTGPFTITQPARISAAFFGPGEATPEFSVEADFQRALYPPPRYVQPYSDKWPGQGVLNMVDGKRGSVYTDASCQGFEQNDMDIIVDLGGKKEVSGVSVRFLQYLQAWIFFPEKVEWFISHDGANFEKVGEKVTVNEFERQPGNFTEEYSVSFDTRMTNFIRVRAKSIGMCPPWHVGYEYKGKAWLFSDEIVIR